VDGTPDGIHLRHALFTARHDVGRWTDRQVALYKQSEGLPLMGQAFNYSPSSF
jgi:hypothetical protein